LVCLTFYSSEHHALDERIDATCHLLLANNLHSGNFGSLLHVFLGRASELLASAQTDKYDFAFSIQMHDHDYWMSLLHVSLAFWVEIVCWMSDWNTFRGKSSLKVVCA